jgi:hypothetical protein
MGSLVQYIPALAVAVKLEFIPDQQRTLLMLTDVMAVKYRDATIVNASEWVNLSHQQDWLDLESSTTQS